MSNNKTIPAKDADFNVWQDTIVQAAIENSTEWLLDTDWLDKQLEPARAAWTTAWEAYQNPGTRTKLITATKKEKRADYEKLLMILAANLRANTRLTDDDRRAAGLSIRDAKPTPSPVPVTYPIISVDTSIMRRLILKYRDSGSTTTAKPKGIHGAEIKWLISEERPMVEELINSAFDTGTPYMIDFEDAQRGKRVWICLRWENTRGEKGPWGQMVNAIIP